MIKKFLTFIVLLLAPQVAYLQNATIKGNVIDVYYSTPLVDASVVISGTGKIAATDKDGEFSVSNVPDGNYTLVVTANGYLPDEFPVTVQGGKDVVKTMALMRDPNAVTRPTVTDIPTITLEEAEAETEGSGEVANLLNASRDVFQQVSGFAWNNFRFRERGYDSEHFPLFLNNVSINDPETGFAFYGEIGGLNDVLRNRESSIGLAPAEYTFSEIGGATRLDTRASVQRKQVRASYAKSNRTYTDRVMLTMNTGLMPGGWAVSASGSRRWGQEGYYQGTFFDGYSYFLS
ncbi:MAG: carboxypeptidase-like regulatory domain-containing protein, partial [Saprospiraceae bacterium]